jgi:hypothetical protein
MGAPGPPDMVERSSEITEFRNWGGGPVGHPQGAQVKTLTFNMKYLPKDSHVYSWGLPPPQTPRVGGLPPP